MIKFTSRYERNPDMLRFFSEDLLENYFSLYHDRFIEYCQNINVQPFILHYDEILYEHFNVHLTNKKEKHKTLCELFVLNRLKEKSSKRDSLLITLFKDNFIFHAKPQHLTISYLDFIFENQIDAFYLSKNDQPHWEYVLLEMLSLDKYSEASFLWNKTKDVLCYSILSDSIIEKDIIFPHSLLYYIINNKNCELSLFLKKAIFNIDYTLIEMRKNEKFSKLPFHISHISVNKDGFLDILNDRLINIQTSLNKAELHAEIEIYHTPQLPKNRL